jgi:hypothetical protein
MVRHSTNTASLCSVLLAALIVSLSLVGVAAAQTTSRGTKQTILVGPPTSLINTTGSYNTASGALALLNNTTGSDNTAIGYGALLKNTTGSDNTATGFEALFSTTTGFYNTASGALALFNTTTGSYNTASGALALLNNTTGSDNTAIGYGADVSAGNLVNATAIGFRTLVNASNKIRLGNTAVTVIEGQVPFTSSSDKTKKENFRPVDGEAVLGKIRGLALTSWNFIGHDPKAFRHYGPMAQDFFAAFGHDDVGQIGSETTINAGDMAGILLSAVQALEQRTAELQQKEAQMAGLAAQVDALHATLASKEAQMAGLAAQVDALHATLASVETVVTRLEALEQRTHRALQITAEN